MEHKKIIALTCIVVLSVLIAGCNLAGSKDSSGIEQQDIYVGTGAVDVEFIAETIPNWEVEPHETVTLSAELVNRGAHNIQSGRVIIEGFPQQNLEQRFQAEGKTIYQPEGGYPVRINFNPITITDEKPFLLTACYLYKTWFKGSLCYDPDMRSDTDIIKACTFQQSYSSKELGNGQGAPLAVTDIEIRRKDQGNSADIVVRIRNLGGGLLRNPSYPEIDCQKQQQVDHTHRNKARLTKLMFNNVDISSSCTYNKDKLSGLLQFSESGEATIDCEATNLALGGASIRAFEIELDYGYVTQSSTQMIRVKKTFA